MHVHFFVTFSKDASNSIFAQELKKQDIDFRIFSEQVSLQYTTRLWLYFVGWPRIILFAVRQALRSLRSRPQPDWIVVGSHFELLAVSVLKKIMPLSKPRLVLLGFIYTDRKSPILAKLKFFYMWCVLRLADCIICYSPYETQKNSKLFDLPNTRFEYMPFGLHLALPEDIESLKSTQGEYALSAGRSGRDYNLLIEAFSHLDYPLHIVSDLFKPSAEITLANNISILNHCYGKCYRHPCPRWFLCPC